MVSGRRGQSPEEVPRSEPFAALFSGSPASVSDRSPPEVQPNYGAVEALSAVPPSYPYGAVEALSAVPPSEKAAFEKRASASWSAPTPEPPSVQPPHSSWLQVIAGCLAPAVYIALYCIFDIFAAKSSKEHGGYYTFEPACMVLIVELGKLAVSLLILVCWSQPEIPSAARALKTARNFLPVACCFAIGNILMLVCLAKVSLAHYGVWYQTSIFFNAFMWYIAFRRPFGTQRCIALAILALGCVVNSIEPGMVWNFDRAIFWVILSAFVAALGCVLNEYFMKEDFKLDLTIQNSILYIETSLACLIIIAIINPVKLSSPSAFFAGFHGDCWIIAGLSIFIGLSVSWILKFANLITKTFAVAIHCPIEMVLAHYVIDVQVSAFTVISALIIGVSIGVYSTAPKYENAIEKAMSKDDAKV